MEPVGDTSCGGEVNHLVHHVAAAGHHKAHLRIVAQHFCGGLYEIFRTFLHGDTSQECHYLLLAARRIHIEQLLAQWSHGIVYGSHLGRVDAVFVDYRGAGEITYRDYVVGVEHTITLDVEHGRVHIAARAVEVGGVYVDYHRLAGHLLGMYACGICEPVVGVDYVKLLGTGDDTGAYRVVVDFLQKVIGIASGKFYTAQVVEAHIVEVGIDMVAQTEVFVGVHYIADAAFYIFAAYVAPSYRHLRRSDYLGE